MMAEQDLICIQPGWASHPTAAPHDRIELDCTIPAYSRQGHHSDIVRQGSNKLWEAGQIGWKWGHEFGVGSRLAFAYPSYVMCRNATTVKQTATVLVEGRHAVAIVFLVDGYEFWIDGKLIQSVTGFTHPAYPAGLLLGSGGRGSDSAGTSSVVFHSVKVDGQEILIDPVLELHDGASFGTLPTPEARSPVTHTVTDLGLIDWTNVVDGDTLLISGQQVPPTATERSFFTEKQLAIQKRVSIVGDGTAVIYNCRQFGIQVWESLGNGRWSTAKPSFAVSGIYDDSIGALSKYGNKVGTATASTWEIDGSSLTVNNGSETVPPNVYWADYGYQFDVSYQPHIEFRRLRVEGVSIINTTSALTSKPAATGVAFRNVAFHHCGVSLYRGWDNWRFEACQFSDTSYGIYTRNISGKSTANGLTVEGCRFWNCRGGDGHAIGIQNSNDVTIRGNVIHNCGNANGSICAWSGQGKTLMNLVIEDNVIIDDESSWAGAISLSGVNPDSAGLKSARIVGNHIYNPYEGIRFNWLADQVVIEGNVIDSPRSHGICGQSNQPSSQAVIINNQVLNVPTGSQAVYVTSPGSIVK